MEACVSFEGENLCAWGTSRAVAWPSERSVSQESWTSFFFAAAKGKGCSGAGMGVNIARGMVSDDAEVGKET